MPSFPPASGGGDLQLTTDLGNTTDNDMEITDSDKGTIFTDADGKRWRRTIAIDGRTVATELTP